MAAFGTDTALILGLRKLPLVGFQGARNTGGVSAHVVLPTVLAV